MRFWPFQAISISLRRFSFILLTFFYIFNNGDDDDKTIFVKKGAANPTWTYVQQPISS